MRVIVIIKTITYSKFSIKMIEDSFFIAYDKKNECFYRGNFNNAEVFNSLDEAVDVVSILCGKNINAIYVNLDTLEEFTNIEYNQAINLIEKRRLEYKK